MYMRECEHRVVVYHMIALVRAGNESEKGSDRGKSAVEASATQNMRCH